MNTTPLYLVLANTFTMYVRAHVAHWNIVDPNFHSLHGFLGDVYASLWEAVDDIAEHIRIVGGTVSPSSLVSIAAVRSADPGSNWEAIRQALISDNEIVIAELQAALEAADEAENEALANFLADRLDKHAKLGWMLKASR